MIGSFSSASPSKSLIYPSSTGEIVSRRDQIKNPTASELSKPNFRKFILALFTVPDRSDLDEVRAEIINNVKKLGTVAELNAIFKEIREAGIRPVFPNINMGKVDCLMIDDKPDVLTWFIHDDASEAPFDGESTSWTSHGYQLNRDTGKWLPRYIEEGKEKKSK